MFFSNGIKMNRLIEETRTWLGTPFHHQGRVKQVGCDCIGLIVGVAAVLGRPEARYDRQDYGRLPDGNRLYHLLKEHCVEVSQGDMRPADIALFRFDSNPQHVGILSDYPGGGLGVIHAYAQARKVVEHYLDESWKAKIVAVFRWREVGIAII